MMTNTLITNLIERASERIGTPSEVYNGVQLYHTWGVAREQTNAGEIECYVLTTERRSSFSNKPHVKATFKLGGKVISRANLEKVLGQ